MFVIALYLSLDGELCFVNSFAETRTNQHKSWRGSREIVYFQICTKYLPRLFSGCAGLRPNDRQYSHSVAVPDWEQYPYCSQTSKTFAQRTIAAFPRQLGHTLIPVKAMQQMPKVSTSLPQMPQPRNCYAEVRSMISTPSSHRMSQKNGANIKTTTTGLVHRLGTPSDPVLIPNICLLSSSLARGRSLWGWHQSFSTIPMLAKCSRWLARCCSMTCWTCVWTDQRRNWIKRFIVSQPSWLRHLPQWKNSKTKSHG